MKGSLHLTTVSGIPVKIHWTFGLLLLWVAYETGKGKFDPWFVLISLGIVLSVFFCVILHEFGHSFAARKFGVQTHDILMTPIGGIARLERMPEGRGQEFWVAIAGPVVNFIIVGLIWLGFYVFEGTVLPIFSFEFWEMNNGATSYFRIIMMANGYLGMFNLLPAFPMDGGRMLRSLLSLRIDRQKATQIASYVGQGIALLMFSYGIYQGHPTMTLIGVFIFFAARQEFQALVRQNRLTTLKATDIMDPIQHDLFLGMTLDEAGHIIGGKKELSSVVWSRPGIPAGYITRDRILGGTPEEKTNLIDAWVIPAPVAIPPDFSAGQVHAVMKQHKLPLVLVFDKTNYLGVIHWEHVVLLVK
jgi:Zn-dependent protease